jgi:nicotinamide-nucleotide amidase
LPGSSAFFKEGLVTYSNESKERMLEVPKELLVEHGAVSEPVAREMAEGARRVAGADYGLSITGIAGPDGGTKEKPVGLVFVGLSDAQGASVERLDLSAWARSRGAIRERSANRAFDLLRLRLEGKES